MENHLEIQFQLKKQIPIFLDSVFLKHLKKDENNNAIIGENVFLIDSENCLINMPDNKLVLIDGLKDYIVVESDNMLMILKNSNEQDLKKYLKQLEEAKSQFFKN